METIAAAEALTQTTTASAAPEAAQPATPENQVDTTQNQQNTNDSSSEKVAPTEQSEDNNGAAAEAVVMAEEAPSVRTEGRQHGRHRAPKTNMLKKASQAANTAGAYLAVKVGEKITPRNVVAAGVGAMVLSAASIVLASKTGVHPSSPNLSNAADVLPLSPSRPSIDGTSIATAALDAKGHANTTLNEVLANGHHLTAAQEAALHAPSAGNGPLPQWNAETGAGSEWDQTQKAWDGAFGANTFEHMNAADQTKAVADFMGHDGVVGHGNQTAWDVAKDLPTGHQVKVSQGDIYKDYVEISAADPGHVPLPSANSPAAQFVESFKPSSTAAHAGGDLAKAAAGGKHAGGAGASSVPHTGTHTPKHGGGGVTPKHGDGGWNNWDSAAVATGGAILGGAYLTSRRRQGNETVSTYQTAPTGAENALNPDNSFDGGWRNGPEGTAAHANEGDDTPEALAAIFNANHVNDGFNTDPLAETSSNLSPLLPHEAPAEQGEESGPAEEPRGRRRRPAAVASEAEAEEVPVIVGAEPEPSRSSSTGNGGRRGRRGPVRRTAGRALSGITGIPAAIGNAFNRTTNQPTESGIGGLQPNELPEWQAAPGTLEGPLTPGELDAEQGVPDFSEDEVNDAALGAPQEDIDAASIALPPRAPRNGRLARTRRAVAQAINRQGGSSNDDGENQQPRPAPTTVSPTSIPVTSAAPQLATLPSAGFITAPRPGEAASPFGGSIRIPASSATQGGQPVDVIKGGVIGGEPYAPVTQAPSPVVVGGVVQPPASESGSFYDGVEESTASIGRRGQSEKPQAVGVQPAATGTRAQFESDPLAETQSNPVLPQQPAASTEQRPGLVDPSSYFDDSSLE